MMSLSSRVIWKSQSISSLRRAVGFGVVAIEPLHDLDVVVVDRRRRVEDDVAQPRRVLDVELAAERHVPLVAHVALGGRLGRAGDAVLHRRIGDRDERLGLEAVVGLLDLVFLRQRLVELAERALVDEGKMRVVEGVLHQAERRRVPHFVELRDAPEARIVSPRRHRGSAPAARRAPPRRSRSARRSGRPASRGSAPPAAPETAGRGRACRCGRRSSRDSRRRSGRPCTSPWTAWRCDGSSGPSAPRVCRRRRGTARCPRRAGGTASARPRDRPAGSPHTRSGAELSVWSSACGVLSALTASSGFPLDRAVVPRAERELRQADHDQEQRDAGER